MTFLMKSFIVWNLIECLIFFLFKADDIEKILCHKFMRFMMMRAEHFTVLRRKPVEVIHPLWFWSFKLVFSTLFCSLSLWYFFWRQITECMLHFLKIIFTFLSFRDMTLASSSQIHIQSRCTNTSWSISSFNSWRK